MSKDNVNETQFVRIQCILSMYRISDTAIVLFSITCGLMHTSLGHLFWDADVSQEPANKSTVQYTVQKNEWILL